MSPEQSSDPRNLLMVTLWKGTRYLGKDLYRLVPERIHRMEWRERSPLVIEDS